MSNFTVSILRADASVVWSETYLPPVGISQWFTLPDNTIGQIVKVSLNAPNWLSLAEVQVFERTPTNPVPIPGAVWLLGSGLLGLLGLKRKVLG